MTNKQSGSSSSKTTSQPIDPAEAFGARFNAALRNARLTPADLWRRLCSDYGLNISRATVYDAHHGRVQRPKYLLEIAEITKVNYQWLARGTGTMVDISGRRSDREKAAQQIRNLLNGHLVPERRNDLIRLADRFLTRLLHHQIDYEQAQILDRALSLVGEDARVDERLLKQWLDNLYYHGQPEPSIKDKPSS